ncbi:hypothetical protein KY290_025236 [Solanum tuberosum]|uniref:DUF4283 domain-containing protein n=1 Tax=Solanum tuberosum TaxID=4113 RepID=A0ABQ7USY3_SOLTU|nr:hypothetical protein KY284_024038 [Solanum tuberosum]KAH0754966.1 hypothetical protein KY290_025236 [Solanum tuberosum]
MSLTVGLPVLGAPPLMALRPSSSLNPKFSNLPADFPPLPAPKSGYPATQNPSTFDNHLLVQSELFPSLETKGVENTKSSYANLARNRNAQRPKVRLPPRTHNFLNGKSLGGLNIMKIIKWSTKFKPDADNTLAPVWINLPDLKWYFYEWDAICRIVGPIWTPLLLDKTTLAKTRPTTAKVRVEIDLTKPLVNEVLLEVTNVAGITELQGHQDENCKKLHPELRDMEGGTLAREQRMELQPIIGESTLDNKDAMEIPLKT